MPVQFDIEFDVDEVCKDLQRRLDPEELLPRPAGNQRDAHQRLNRVGQAPRSKLSSEN